MEPKTFGSLFAYFYRYPVGSNPPLINRHGWTRETDGAFRSGTNCLLRLPFSRWTLVVGRWRLAWGEDMEEEALMNALDGRFLRLSAEDIRTWR